MSLFNLTSVPDVNFKEWGVFGRKGKAISKIMEFYLCLVHFVNLEANSFYILALSYNKYIFLIHWLIASYACEHFYQSITCLYYNIFKNPYTRMFYIKKTWKGRKYAINFISFLWLSNIKAISFEMVCSSIMISIKKETKAR